MAYSGACIYGLYNVMESKIYIGESANIEKRFYAHKRNFALKSNANPMYQEPIENFIFIVLLEMTSDEHEKMGEFLESLFIAKALREKMGLYNRNKLNEDVTGEALFFFKIWDSIDDAIQKEVGQPPWVLRMMSEKSRRKMLENISA